MRLLSIVILLTALTVLPVFENDYALSARKSICESSDEEDGPDVYERGTTKVSVDGEIIEKKEDVCATDGQLIEYFCDPKYRTISERHFPCRQGCIEGRCITQVGPPPAPNVTKEAAVSSPAPPPEKPEEAVVAGERTTQVSGAPQESSEGDIPPILARSFEWVIATLMGLFHWLSGLFTALLQGGQAPEGTINP